MKARFHHHLWQWEATLMILFLLCPDGQYPGGTLTPDGNGNFYGVTPEGGPSFSFLNGGNNGYGTIFEFSTLTDALTTLASFDGLNGLGNNYD